MSDKRAVRIFWPFVRMPPPRLDGLSAGQVWREAQRAKWGLRSRRAFVVEGACLAPYFSDGDVVWIDQEKVPVDGDLVAAHVTYREQGAVRPRTETHVAIKVLRINGERWLLCALDGAVSIEPQCVIGPVIGWYRPGWWRRPAVKRLAAAVSTKRRQAFGELKTY